VNFEMVRRDAGWFDPEYAKDEELYLVENVARDGKVGLWALPLEKRIEPWVWRGMSKDRKCAEPLTALAAIAGQAVVGTGCGHPARRIT